LIARVALGQTDDERQAIEFCENGAKAAQQPLARHTRIFQNGALLNFHQSDYWLKQGRIVQLMLLGKGSTHYEPIGWDEASR